MPGIRDFTTIGFSYKNIVTKAANYTILTTDEYVKVNGAYTMTLPALNSLGNTITKKKSYKIENIGTSNVTVSPGTDSVTGVANTISGKSVYTVMPNEYIIITGTEVGTDWTIEYPFPKPALIRVPFNAVVTTSGTTPQNVFDADGAPTNIDITAILVIATVTLAGTITTKNGTDTVSAVAKSTTTGAVVGEDTLAVPAVAKGSVCTVESDGGNATVIIFGTQQVYA